ncbi:MAG: hypothetical protein Q9170_003829 [Blastenia crenularia]
MTATQSNLDTVTGIFGQMKTTDDRDSFLSSLVRSIPKQHVRELAYHAASVEFRFDIVGHLPLELLCLVFKNLEIYQAFQLRRVCKRWFEALSAPHLVESLLHQWFAMGEVNLRMPPNVSAAEALAIKAEHVDAFKTGNPFSMIQRRKSIQTYGPGSLSGQTVAYSHGRVAWIQFDDGSTVLHVLGLESGEEKRHLAAFDESLAIVHSPEVGNNRVSITTWNMDSHQTRSFTIQLHGTSGAQDPQLDFHFSITNASILFLEREKGPPDEVFYTRCTHEGGIIAEGTSGPIGHTFRSGYFCMDTYPSEPRSTMRPFSSLDRVRIEDESDLAIQEIRATVLDDTPGIVRVIYDLHSNQIQSFTIPCQESEINGENYWHFWKNVGFSFSHNEHGRPVTAAVDLESGAMAAVYMHQLEYAVVTEDRQNNRNFREMWSVPLHFWGDEIYLAIGYADGISVFCFDKHITMAGDNKDFRQHRKAAWLERTRARHRNRREQEQSL